MDELLHDPSDEVRAAVARQGYGLKALATDKSGWVRFAVLEMLEKRSKQNAGYEIIARTNIEGKGYALGFNPNAPVSYVTWSFNPTDGTYCHGHYFTQKAEAMIDLAKRTVEEMNLEKQVLKNSLFPVEDIEQRETDKSENPTEAKQSSDKESLEKKIQEVQKNLREKPSTNHILLER